MRYISHNEAETIEIAKKIVKKLRSGHILALTGDLGTGKTTLVKGLAQGFKIKQIIHSPTFVLMRIFQIPKFYPERSRRTETQILKFVHIDAYRLHDETELMEIGALDFLGQSGVLTIIEWADRIKLLLKKFGKKVIWINFDYGRKENERIIKVKLPKTI